MPSERQTFRKPKPETKAANVAFFGAAVFPPYPARSGPWSPVSRVVERELEKGRRSPRVRGWFNRWGWKGTHEDLMELDGRYATLYHQQEL